MKKHLIILIKLLFIAFILLIPTKINNLLFIVVLLSLSLLFKYHHSILLLAPLINLEYNLLYVSIGIIIVNLIFYFIINKQKIISFLFLSIELALCLFIFDYSLNTFFILLGIGILLLIIIMLLIKNDTLKSYVYQIRYFEIAIIALAISNIALSDYHNTLLIPLLIIYLSFITDKYSFLVIAFLNATLSYIKLDNNIVIRDLIILLIGYKKDFLLLPVIYIYSLLYLDYSLIHNIAFIIISLLIHLYFMNKKDIISINHSLKSIDVFDNYLEITSNYLNKTANSNLILEAKMKEIKTNYCDNCTSYKICFNKNKAHTYAYFYLCLTSQKDLKELPLTDSLKRFILACPYYKTLKELEKITFNKNNLPMINHIHTLNESLRQELGSLKHQTKLDKLYQYLINLGYDVTNYNYVIKDNLYEISCKINNISHDKLDKVLVYQVSSFLKKPYLANLENNIITFYPKPNLKLSFEHHIMAKNNDYLSGDNVLIKKDYGYKYTFALSDGMGSGFNAYCQSKEMLSLINKVMSLPLNTNTNLELIKNAYQLKENIDNYATLDLLQIDLVNKYAKLYKFGSTNTYHISKGELRVLTNNNPPLSLAMVNESFDFKIDKGDLIIMVSDGITNYFKDDEINDFFVSLYFKNVSVIVKEIMEFVYIKQKRKLLDDLTALAIKVL